MKLAQVMFLAAVLSGLSCSSPNIVPMEECTSVYLSYSEKVQTTVVIDGLIRPQEPPKEVIRVRAKAVKVNLPFLDTPSIAGERASVWLEVSEGSVPQFPKCSLLVVGYDSYVNPFKFEEQYTLLFLANGRFWGCEGFFF